MAQSRQSESNKSIWDLSLYELSRTPQVPTEDDSEIVVSLRAVGIELKCPICLDLLKNTVAAKECLHRFCCDCITTALRTGNKECPTCRKKIVSRRSLRPDPNFDQIISKLFPDRNEVEAYDNRIFNEVTKYGFQGKDASKKRRKTSKVETVTASSSNSENILQGNMENLLEDNEGMVRSSLLLSLSSTESPDMLNQTDENPTTSSNTDNVNPETSREPIIERQAIQLSSESDTTNDNVKHLKLETPGHQDILLQPSTSAFSLNTSCVNSRNSSSETEETEMPETNEQASASTRTNSDHMSEGNINLSSQEFYLNEDIALQPFGLFSLSSNKIVNEYGKTDCDKYKIYEQTAILSSISNPTTNSVEFSHQSSLLQNSMRPKQSKKDFLNKLDLTALLSSDESNNSLSLNLGRLNLSSDEDDTKCENIPFQSDRNISSGLPVLSSKCVGSNAIFQKSLDDQIANKLNNRMNMFSLPISDISKEGNFSDLTSLTHRTTLAQTAKSTTPDFDNTNKLSKKKPKKERGRRKKFGKEKLQKAVVSSNFQLSRFKRSRGHLQLESNINSNYPNAGSSGTNTESLRQSNIPSEERKEKKHEDNMTFEEKNTYIGYQESRNTLSVKKRFVNLPRLNKNIVKAEACSEKATYVSSSQAHSSSADLIQESFEKSVKTNEKVNVRKRRGRPPLSKNTTSNNIELILKLHPSEVSGDNQIHKVLSKNLIRFIKTTRNATMNHLGKYLVTCLADGLDKQTSETCDVSQFCFYVLSVSNSYIQLDGDQTLDQVHCDHGKVGDLLEIYYSYKLS